MDEKEEKPEVIMITTKPMVRNDLIVKKNTRFIAKALEHTPGANEMLSQLMGIYSAEIARLSREGGELSSKQIKDLALLVQSLATINKEVRETNKDKSHLEGLSVEEQLKLLMVAMASLNGETDEA